MGKRGPKPMPTALKLAAGVRADRVNMDSPVGPSGDPEPPAWLDGFALEEWWRILPLIRSMGILSKIDGVALGVYCSNYARFVEAESRSLNDPNPTSPWHKFRDQALASLRRSMDDFGLTPSARSSLKAAAPADGSVRLPSIGADKLDDWKAQRRKGKV